MMKQIQLCFYLFLILFKTTAEAVKICYPHKGAYKNYFPLDENSNDEDIVYSVSNHQRISRPIVAYLCTQNNKQINENHPLYSTEENPLFFNIVSQPAIIRREEEGNNTCETSMPFISIRICQRAANDYPLSDPRRFYYPYFQSRCSSTVDISQPVTLSTVKIQGSYLIAQGIFHEISNNSFDRQYCFTRNLTFDVFKPNQPDVITSSTTNTFKIYTQIPRLTWDNLPIEDVFANHFLNLTLKIVDQNNERITTGLDSTLIVEVTVAYHHKTFMRTKLVEDFLHTTEAKLAGKEVITSFRNYDQVLHKRATEGLVEFKNVVIEDAYYQQQLVLNATLMVPRTGDRQPLTYSDLCVVFKQGKEQFSCLEFKDYLTGSGCDLAVVDVDDEPITTTPKPTLYSMSFRCFSEDDVKSTIYADLKALEQEANEIHVITLDNPQVDVSMLYSMSDSVTSDKKIYITSHFQIPGLWIVVLDKDGRRIFSGRDSALQIEVTSDPSTIKLSKNGTTFITHRGIGSFIGSVQETVSSVRFVFSTRNSKGVLLTAESNSYVVTDQVNIALFGRFNTVGSSGDPDPVVESFTRFAMEDVNGISTPHEEFLQLFTKSNLSINIRVFDTEQDYARTTQLFTDLMYNEDNRNFSDMIRGIIGFGDNEITHKMYPLVKVEGVPIITYREDIKEFIRKDSHLNMMSIGWNLVSRSIHIGHFFQLYWNYIVVVEDVDIPMEYDFREGVTSIFTYTVIYRMFVGNQESLKEEIATAKNTGSKFIYNFVYAPKQYFLFREAIKYEWAPIHGYVWLSSDFHGKQFDWENKHPYCQLKPTCTEAFQGMMIIWGIQNVSYLSTKLWYHVNRKFFEMNPADYRGVPTTQPFFIFGQIALGYDAVLTYAHSLERQLQNNNTITKDSTHKAMIGLKFEGLTGYVEYSTEGGWRTGSMYAMLIVQAKQSFHDFNSVQYTRWMTLSKCHLLSYIESISRKKRLAKTNLALGKLSTLQQVIEIPVESTVKLRGYKSPYFPNFFPQNAEEIRLVARFYLSTRGYISNKRQLKSHKEKFNLDHICIRTEFIIGSYYCDKTCGGHRLYADSAVEYRHGVCELPNECRCRIMKEVNSSVPKEEANKLAYSGENCKIVMCHTCYHGTCWTPYNCTCLPGWLGADCNTSECSSKCVNGKCITPNHCTCNAGYYGSNCNTLVGVMIAVIAVSVTIIIIIAVFCVRWLNQKRMHKFKIEQLDWLVDWREVVEEEKPSAATTPPSTIVDILHPTTPSYSFKCYSQSLQDSDVIFPTLISMEKIVRWKGVSYYTEKFDSLSLDASSVTLQKEIMQLRDLKHPNLIRCYGVCLTAPNVALLLEIVPKGSLYEILQNDAFNLVWNFKFSILKDIANGMAYIHNSKLVSHGRLMSKNCLIDNRWTCKVTGFGVPSLRVNAYQNKTTDEIHRRMLWSAPELLRVYSSLNDIKNGTKLGDVYSYGIVMTEMCTHDPPFNYELQLLSMDEMMRLLRQFYDPSTLGLKRLLDKYDYDTSKPIRPALINARMPEIYSEKKGVENLIIMTTAEEPAARLNFNQILEKLDLIHPFKGELIENLIFMLEKYTNHLQEIFFDKITEVQLEKRKTEELIGRLLPPSIAEQMQENSNVTPQLHQNVTFFYSDIVGFTPIAKESKPMEVVEMLNDLYTCFDNIIEMFDAYKLETIGDAYFVASGVPLEVADHFEQIATMALYILSAVNVFPIRHMPNKRLSVRIGIHSGSCVAGVLGVKMPRYCVFGEDVTIAQFMESKGEPNFIQVSETTAKLLDRVGVYYLNYRGEIDTEFLGTFHTYWLIGKQGLTMEAPIGARQLSPTMTSSQPSQRESAASEETESSSEINRKRKSTLSNISAKSVKSQPDVYKTSKAKSLSLIRSAGDLSRLNMSEKTPDEEHYSDDFEKLSSKESSDSGESDSESTQFSL